MEVQKIRMRNGSKEVLVFDTQEEKNIYFATLIGREEEQYHHQRDSMLDDHKHRLDILDKAHEERMRALERQLAESFVKGNALKELGF